MIDFSKLNIKRIINHRVHSKKPKDNSATIEPSTTILQIDAGVQNILRKRIVDAAGSKSKAFELEISNTEIGSFYDLCKDIKSVNSNDFIKRTEDIATLLAHSQKKSIIPGGFLIFLDAELETTKQSVYIVIKAELHEALKYNLQGNKGTIELLKEIFLSPSQKLYKIAILYEKNYKKEYDLENFSCLVFDDQFRLEGKPAEYFFKDFLGFSIENNSKIQSKLFYDKCKDFIEKSEMDINDKSNLIKQLKLLFTLDQETTISPKEFGKRFLKTTEQKDLFETEVVNKIPLSFVKDKTLLEKRLEKRKVNFSENTILYASENEFDENVKIINSQEAFSNIKFDDTSYTILMIKGKPYD
jgi:hypothetical protein